VIRNYSNWIVKPNLQTSLHRIHKIQIIRTKQEHLGLAVFFCRLVKKGISFLSSAFERNNNLCKEGLKKSESMTI